MATIEIPWRNTILTQLQQRNKTQTYCFQGLILQCNKLFDTANLQPFQGDKYNAGQTTTQPDSKTSEAIENLNHKLLTQQEELTEMHRRKGENAQNIIDLNNKLQEKEQEIAEQNIRLKEASNLNVSLQSQINRYSSNIKELEKINFTLRDEHTTLRLEHSSLEEKLRKVQDENRQLMDGLISYKSKDADKLNEENDNFVRKKHAKVQKDLEDACKDSKGASVEEAIAPVYMGISSLPKRATLTFEAHEGEIYAVKYNPVDRMLATGGSDRKIKLWNVTTGVPQKVGILSGNSGGVNDIDFSATGSLLIGACSDRASRIWTVRDQRVISITLFHSDKVFAAKFLGEDKVVTGSMDRTIKIWDARKGDCLETKLATSMCYTLVTVDHRGTTIISGHHNQYIYFWDVRIREKLSKQSLGGRVSSLDLKRDANLLLCCVRDENALKLLDLRMNKVIHTLCCEDFKVGLDTARATISPDGKYAAAGGTDGNVYIWDVELAQLATVLKSHKIGLFSRSPVYATAWNPDGGSLVSVDKTKTVVVWGE